MYALNGFNLDSNSLGGYLLFDSQPYAGINRRSNSFQAGARDGRIAVPWQNDAPVIALVERLPAANLGAFEALLNSATLELNRTDVADRFASVELTSLAVENLATADAWVDVRFTLQFNDVYWRAEDVTTYTPVALDSPSVTVQVFSGISAPIRDAIIRVKGGAAAIVLTGSNGTQATYGTNLATTSWFRFESATGRAFTTTTDTWTGGTEVTGLVQNGVGPYFLELAPTFTTPGDPTTRVAELRVIAATRSGTPTVEVRGRNAFLV